MVCMVRQTVAWLFYHKIRRNPIRVQAGMAAILIEVAPTGRGHTEIRCHQNLVSKSSFQQGMCVHGVHSQGITNHTR